MKTYRGIMTAEEKLKFIIGIYGAEETCHLISIAGNIHKTYAYAYVAHFQTVKAIAKMEMTRDLSREAANTKGNN